MDHQAKALCPLDGRYKDRIGELLDDFSEFGQTRLRVKVEVAYLRFLDSLHLIPCNEGLPKDWLSTFSEEDFHEIKEIEAFTNHDVKAIEMWIGSKLPKGMDHLIPWIHFGLTSQDVAGTAYALALKDFTGRFVSLIGRVCDGLGRLALDQPSMAMLGHTHGQVATPTTMNSELYVFRARLKALLDDRKDLKHMTKFGGAVGKMNAHRAAFPDMEWPALLNTFVESLGLQREQATTQISSYDAFAKTFHWMTRVATVMIDLCRDLWLYLSKGYLTLKTKKEEVGSSTMPHKVNPMHFENAEGNFELGSVILSFLALRLPRSRLQRDLTDSTLCRSIGTGLGHLVVAMTSLLAGLDRVVFCYDQSTTALHGSPQVLAEAYQTILRREGFGDAYERLKSLTRGHEVKVSLEDMHAWVDDQKDFSPKLKDELKALTPTNYLGYTL